MKAQASGLDMPLWKLVAALIIPFHALRKGVLGPVEVLALRRDAMARITELRQTLMQHQPEGKANDTLFPLVAHCDEMARKLLLDSSQDDWPSLQQALFQTDDAGDLFFQQLDTALADNDASQSLLGIFYFCLSDGFEGRYSGNPDKLYAYRNSLRTRIPVEPIQPPVISAAPARLAPIHIPGYAYHIGAALILLACYWVLRVKAGHMPPVDWPR
jgi:type IV/VI secretion system ImpK/VasF family protein